MTTYAIDDSGFTYIPLPLKHEEFRRMIWMAFKQSRIDRKLAHDHTHQAMTAIKKEFKQFFTNDMNDEAYWMYSDACNAANKSIYNTYENKITKIEKEFEEAAQAAYDKCFSSELGNHPVEVRIWAIDEKDTDANFTLTRMQISLENTNTLLSFVNSEYELSEPATQICVLAHWSSAIMLTLDIAQALRFLDALDPGGRHTLASEAPFGGWDNGPKWERGKTFEARQRPLLVKEIEERQARGSNVYYSVNRPRPASDQKGFGGKCNLDDIIAIRALAFDIDHCHDVSLTENGLSSALRPSFIINTGGGLHLIYLLKDAINVNLYIPPKTGDEKVINKILTDAGSAVTAFGKDFETMLRRKFPKLKIDSMSNVDRVMRLPGTVNYPNADKRARGQIESLAHIEKDYQRKIDFSELRALIPVFAELS